MNTDDLNFAYKVRHALNERLDTLPASITDRLAAARQAALARKKADAPLRVTQAQLVTATAGGGGLGGRFFGAEQFSWMTRLSVIIPLLALVIGMGGIYHHEQQRRIAEIAELDAAVLSDELPLSAYLDHGFNAYLANRSEQ
ncbi:DUF3619 family protein [Rugamonas sp.]|uniref:DUF3619 family protein n=1 Tax=Rugamonas sp. TaxID=1926287 RepID=UPI0025D9A333|nr:DUF3619 family protein [Rugamonas sp.]